MIAARAPWRRNAAQRAFALAIALSAAVAAPDPALASEDAPPAAGASGRDDASPVAIRATLSQESYGGAAAGKLFLKVDYWAVADPRPDRPPLDVALVLDQSGSMAEDRKMPHALEAARWIVEDMTDRDVLSVVAFNERVIVLSPAGRVVNKPYLLHRLREVRPGGYTDLSAGLLEGVAQAGAPVVGAGGDRTVRQVFLLTDGLANRGVTDAAGLARIAASARAKGIHVSTFGVGAEFDERLLTSIASGGGGRYTYVKTPEQLPKVFAEELRGVVQVVAQNAVVELRVTGARIARVVGGEPSGGAPPSPYRAEVGNLRAGERGVLVLELAPLAFEDGAAVEVETGLTFDDAVLGERMSLAARSRAGFAPGGAGRDETVVLYAAVLDALDRAEDAAAGLDVERYRDASARFGDLYGRAREHAVRTRDQELLNQVFLLKHFMEELAAAAEEGLLHGHAEARERLEKEGHYQHYLRGHHSTGP